MTSVLKIWNSTRNVRKSVISVISAITLNEIIAKCEIIILV